MNRRFATYWAGASLSAIGDSVLEWTLALWAATILGPDGAWMVVAILVASTGPSIVFGPVAGVLVDRWRDKVRIVLVASVASGALTLGVAPLLVAGVPPATQVPVMLAVVVLASALAQLFRPASGIIVRDIVPVASRERTAALFQVTTSSISLVAPALASVLFAAFGAGWSLVINGVGFLLGAVFYRLATRGLNAELALAPPALGETGDVATEGSEGAGDKGLIRAMGSELRDGLRFAWASPVISTLLLALLAGLGGFGVWIALDVFFFYETLGGSTGAYGLLGTAQGAGELIGAALMIRLVDRLGAGRLLAGGLLFVGVVIVAYGLVRSVPAAIAGCFVLGLGFPSINVVIGPMLLRVTPRHLLGRVSGLIGPVTGGAMLLGAAVGGSLYSLTGAEVALGPIGPFDSLRVLIVLSGFGAILAAALVAFRLGRTAAREELARAAGVDPGPDEPPAVAGPTAAGPA